MILSLNCQESQLSEKIKSITEDLADNDTDPEAGELLTEKLYELAEKPVSINSADESELSRLFFLTDFQVKALADYVRSSGKIYSVYEIAGIPGFDRELAGMIVPFITLEPGRKSEKDTLKFKSSLITSFTERFPPSDTSTLGSPWKLCSKYRIDNSRITAGLTFEKDNGEKLFPSKPLLPDFLSAYIAWTGKGPVRKIIIGDFGAHLGIGTNINTGIRTGLSLTAAGYLSGYEEIKPYTSTDENNFFRGAAADFQFNKISLKLFLSGNRIDATFDSTALTDNLPIKSFYRSGLHNSVSSLAKKDVVTEYSCGAGLSYDLDNLRVGVVWSGNRFSNPVKITGNNPENLFDFEGRDNSVLTGYYKAAMKRVILYGEVSLCRSMKAAVVQVVSFRPADRININLVIRKYDPGYTSFHGKGPFATSSGDNMQGIFGNFTFEAARYFFFSAGYDMRWYPWLRYRCSAPSREKKSEIRIRYLPREKISAEISYNYRFTMLDNTESTGITKQTDKEYRSVKAAIRYSVSESLTLSTRFDYRLIRPSGSRGFLLLQDLNIKSRRMPLNFWFRFCIYRTADWDSRIYVYENDLLYSFNVPAFSGEGSRSCFMIDWKPLKKVEIRFKYAVSEPSGSTEIGKIYGDLRLQARLWF